MSKISRGNALEGLLELVSSVDFSLEEIGALLDEIEHLDCLTFPWRETFQIGRAVAVRAENRFVGCAWMYGKDLVDVRVLPRYRRQGIATHLLKWLACHDAKDLSVWRFEFDIAHRGAMEMANRLNAECQEMTRFLCWDGQMEDVPKAFQVAKQEKRNSFEGLERLLKEGLDSLEGESAFPGESHLSAESDLRVVQMEGRDVGFIWSVPRPEGLEIRRLYIDPDWRGMGIGRQLLCSLMREVALKQQSLWLQFSETESDEGEEEEEEHNFLNCLSALGFWVYRTKLKACHQIDFLRTDKEISSDLLSFSP